MDEVGHTSSSISAHWRSAACICFLRSLYDGHVRTPWWASIRTCFLHCFVPRHLTGKFRSNLTRSSRNLRYQFTLLTLSKSWTRLPALSTFVVPSFSLPQIGTPIYCDIWHSQSPECAETFKTYKEKTSDFLDEWVQLDKPLKICWFVQIRSTTLLAITETTRNFTFRDRAV